VWVVTKISACRQGISHKVWGEEGNQSELEKKGAQEEPGANSGGSLQEMLECRGFIRKKKRRGDSVGEGENEKEVTTRSNDSWRG